MGTNKSVDFARLLGFETVCDRMSKGVDFQDGTIGARLGAKVGEVNGIATCEGCDRRCQNK